MATEDGGGNSPPVFEVGDAPNITRLIISSANESDRERKHRCSSWSSPEALTKHLKGINPSNIWYGRGNVWDNINEDFSGVDSLQEAFDMCRNGWKEGGETIERTRSYIHALNPTLPKPIRYAIAGSTPNVPRAVAGNILNMRAPETAKSSRRKTITILYNVCESWVVSKEAICNKAAATAALIDVIESQGFSCEVLCTAKSVGYNRMTDVLTVGVKESHHPVDTNRLAFSLGHSAMFRGIMFADWQSDPLCKDLGRGLGCVASVHASKELNGNNIYVIESSNGTGDKFKDADTTAKEGIQFLIQELQQQGCPAFPKKDHGDDLDKDEEDASEEDDDDFDGEDF
jgi:hypothetical protein